MIKIHLILETDFNSVSRTLMLTDDEVLPTNKKDANDTINSMIETLNQKSND